MERRNNYAIQAEQARKLFCAHDLDAVARAHGLRTDADFLYLHLLSEDYRVSRSSGHIARREGEAWLPADGFDETLTIFDLLCDAKPGRHAAGTWRTTLDFGGQVHRGLLENEKPDALELLYGLVKDASADAPVDVTKANYWFYWSTPKERNQLISVCKPPMTDAPFNPRDVREVFYCIHLVGAVSSRNAG